MGLSIKILSVPKSPVPGLDVKKNGNTADTQPLPDHLLRDKQENNRKMIEASRSILQDVAVMLAASMPCFAVILLDNEGDIIEMIDHYTGLLCLNIIE
jgi:transcriptional regulator of acetoin/glycerol metabolism